MRYTLNKSYDVVEALAKGTAHVKGASETENKDIQIAAQQALSATQRYAHLHNLTERTGWDHTGGIGLPPQISGGALAANTGGSSSAGNPAPKGHAAPVTNVYVLAPVARGTRAIVDIVRI